MEKLLKVGGSKVAFRASALVPRIYRAQFARDVFADVDIIRKSIMEGDPKTELIENLAWAMAKAANEATQPPAEFLNDIPIFAIWQLFPQLIAIWSESNKTIAVSK